MYCVCGNKNQSKHEYMNLIDNFVQLSNLMLCRKRKYWGETANFGKVSDPESNLKRTVCSFFLLPNLFLFLLYTFLESLGIQLTRFSSKCKNEPYLGGCAPHPKKVKKTKKSKKKYIKIKKKLRNIVLTLIHILPLVLDLGFLGWFLGNFGLFRGGVPPQKKSKIPPKLFFVKSSTDS